MQAAAIEQTPYIMLPDDECEARIVEAKQALGERLVILGHHYQRDEVFRHADYSGDSLKLSRQAAHSKADYLQYCHCRHLNAVIDRRHRRTRRIRSDH